MLNEDEKSTVLDALVLFDHLSSGEKENLLNRVDYSDEHYEEILQNLRKLIKPQRY